MTSDELLAGITLALKTQVDAYLTAKIDEALELHVKDKVFDALRERGVNDSRTIDAENINNLEDTVADIVRNMTFDVEVSSDISAEVSVR